MSEAVVGTKGTVGEIKLIVLNVNNADSNFLEGGGWGERVLFFFDLDGKTRTVQVGILTRFII